MCKVLPLLVVDAIDMFLFGSRSRFGWVSLLHYPNSGFALVLWSFALSSTAVATSSSSQGLTHAPETASILMMAVSQTDRGGLPLAASSDLIFGANPLLDKTEEVEAARVASLRNDSFNSVIANPETLAQRGDTRQPENNGQLEDTLSPDVDDNTAPLPQPTSNFDAYRLGPGDTFFVSVRQFPELSFQATLDLQGNVIVPLKGATPFRGLTLNEAQEAIRNIYNRFVVDPEVSITLVAQRPVNVTVLGEVARPGFYPLGAPQILTALLTAGGTTGQADLRAVQIQRQVRNNQVIEDTVDLFTPLREGDALPNVALQDGDVIIVERLDPSTLDEYDRELVSRTTLAQPAITVRLLNRAAAGPGGATAGNLTAIQLPNGSRFADALLSLNLNPSAAKLKEISLIRFDEASGRAVTTTLNGNEAFLGTPSENPPLENNDVIIVDRTFFAQVTFALNTLTQPFRDILGFLLFFESLAGSAEDLFGP